MSDDMPTRLEVTSTGDFLLPSATTERLVMIEEQITRLVQVMDSETLTVSSLYALCEVLHRKVESLHKAADMFVTAAVVQMEQELDFGPAYEQATALDHRVSDLMRMYEELAFGLDLEVTDEQ